MQKVSNTPKKGVHAAPRIDNDKVLLLQKLVIASSGGTAGVRDFNLFGNAKMFV